MPQIHKKRTSSPKNDENNDTQNRFNTKPYVTEFFFIKLIKTWFFRGAATQTIQIHLQLLYADDTKVAWGPRRALSSHAKQAPLILETDRPYFDILIFFMNKWKMAYSMRRCLTHWLNPGGRWRDSRRD